MEKAAVPHNSGQGEQGAWWSPGTERGWPTSQAAIHLPSH